MNALVPRRIKGPWKDKKVISAAAGYGHSLVWTEEGGLYSFGDGSRGQLGHGAAGGYYHEPRRIETVDIRRDAEAKVSMSISGLLSK